MLRKISMLLAISLLLTLGGGLLSCANPPDPMNNVTDLRPGVTPSHVATSDPMTTEEFLAVYRTFGVSMFQNVYASEKGENTLISPLSVMIALTMAANGAGAGETRAQMATVLCGVSSVEALTERLAEYIGTLPSSEQAMLHSANSIWFRETPTLQVKERFLSKMTGSFDAGIYQAPFDDSTKDAINAWCNEHTDGMIPQILDKPIPEQAMLYLINALLFDAQWQVMYPESRLQSGTFTTENGQTQDVTLMYSLETGLLRDEKATGVAKYYDDGGYQFVAMLPNEGVSIEEYIASLSGESIAELMSKREYADVKTWLPKFSTECSYQLNDILSAMGMPAAFDPEAADFSDMASCDAGNLCIGEVIHKTAIEVNEIGTRAAAVTSVGMGAGSMPPEKIYELTFDRPFVYMIVDRGGLPLFIGVVNDVE